MRQAGGGFLLVIGVALAATALFVDVDVTTVAALDDLAGGSIARWALGAVGILLVVAGWGMASDQRPWGP